jgi:hypothetical protein
VQDACCEPRADKAGRGSRAGAGLQDAAASAQGTEEGGRLCCHERRLRRGKALCAAVAACPPRCCRRAAPVRTLLSTEATNSSQGRKPGGLSTCWNAGARSQITGAGQGCILVGTAGVGEGVRNHKWQSRTHGVCAHLLGDQRAQQLLGQVGCIRGWVRPHLHDERAAAHAGATLGTLLLAVPALVKVEKNGHINVVTDVRARWSALSMQSWACSTIVCVERCCCRVSNSPASVCFYTPGMNMLRGKP